MSLTEFFSSRPKEDTDNPLEVLKHLFKRDKIKMTSEVDSSEVSVFARNYFFSNLFKQKKMVRSSRILKGFYDEALEVRVSRARLGRGEFIEGVKHEIREIERQEEKQKELIK